MSTRPPLLLIFGPQGVGKGTQAGLLAAELGIEHLSTGGLLRQAVTQRTVLGRTIEHYIDGGHLVPDDVMLSLVRAHTERLDALGRGFILDGFPRTIKQAVTLKAQLGRPVTATIEVTLPLEVLLDRLVRRRVCPKCGVSSVAADGRINSISCRNGDGVATRRSDDTPAAIAHRLALYRRHTQPVLSWFRQSSTVITICGDASPAEVHTRIIEGLNPILELDRSLEHSGRAARVGL